MTKTRSTVIYFDGGENYKGQFEITQTIRKSWHREALESGQIGYLSGYRYFDGKSDSVLVYFKEKPTQMEIEIRRLNGLRAAKWSWLK